MFYPKAFELILLGFLSKFGVSGVGFCLGAVLKLVFLVLLRKIVDFCSFPGVFGEVFFFLFFSRLLIKQIQVLFCLVICILPLAALKCLLEGICFISFKGCLALSRQI